jgi:hypothetical protein
MTYLILALVAALAYWLGSKGSLSGVNPLTP